MHDIHTKQPSSCSQHKKCTGKIKTKFCVRNDIAIAKLTHKSFWSHTIFLYSIFHAWSFFYCPVCMSTLRTSQNHNHMRLSMKMYCTDHHCNAVWVSYTALAQYKTILRSCMVVLYCTSAIQNNTWALSGCPNPHQPFSLVLTILHTRTNHHPNIHQILTTLQNILHEWFFSS